MREVRAPLFALALGLALQTGCSSGSKGSDGAPPPPDASTVSVEIGIPGGSDSLDFTPLEPGGELRLQTFGQGGTHVFLAIRCIGFGSRAFVSVTIKNLETGAEAVSPAPVRPQLLLCQDDEVTCDLVPILAMTGGLTEPDAERNGLHVEVSAGVRNQAGLEARGSQEGVLSTADL